MKQKKPSWLPDILWEDLQRYRDPHRPANPTEGFTATMLEHHPEADMKLYWSRSGAARWSYAMGLLGVPRKASKTAEERPKDDR